MRFQKLSIVQTTLLWLAYFGSSSAINLSQFAERDRITRDVCVIGGGSSGTYGAIRLREFGKSVVVIEKNNRLGGHTHTYIDPATGIPADYGVMVFDDLPVVHNYFAHFNIPIMKMAQTGPPNQIAVDFRTGEAFTPSTPNAGTPAAIERHSALLDRYPYLDDGFNLPDPVPDDLLLPFGEFAAKYNLGDAVSTISLYCPGGDYLNQPALYILKCFNPQVLAGHLTGFYVTEEDNNSLLYAAALEELGEDALLQSRVVYMERDIGEDIVYVVVWTPSGLKLITAKKVLISIPPMLENLKGFDLSQKERSLFSQFRASSYVTTLLNDTGIPDGLAIEARGVDTPYNLPALPGPYSSLPKRIPGVTNFYYGSEDRVDLGLAAQDITTNILRLRNAGLPTKVPEFLTLLDHWPFLVTVSPEAIAGGFYRDLNALQGERNTYYTGATFQCQDSAMVWNFTEGLVQIMVQEI